MRLPIEHVPGTNPPQFRWKQTINTPNGIISYDHKGGVPPNLEGALLKLVLLATNQLIDIANLKKQVEGMAERITAQSELLSKKAEKPEPQPAPQPQPKKGK